MGKTASKSVSRSLDRDEIVAAALTIVADEGADALTMRRLAFELDVQPPTIYWHVGSRDELITAMLTTQAERLAARPIIGKTPRERVLAAAMQLYTGAVEEPGITSLAHRNGASSLLLSRLEENLIEELVAAGLQGMDVGDAARSILVVVTGALVLRLRANTNRPEDRDDAIWTGVDVQALTSETLRAIVEHHVPGEDKK